MIDGRMRADGTIDAEKIESRVRRQSHTTPLQAWDAFRRRRDPHATHVFRLQLLAAFTWVTDLQLVWNMRNSHRYGISRD